MAKSAAAKKGKPVATKAKKKAFKAPVVKPKAVTVVEEPNEELEAEEGEESSDEEGGRKKKVLPDGTKQDYFTGKGRKMLGVWADGRLCCPMCDRKLPVSMPLTDAQRKAKAKEKKDAAIGKGREFFAHFADLIKTAAEKCGDPIPSDKEIAALIAAGAAGKTGG